MKRFLIIVLAGCVIFGAVILAACGNSAQEQTQAASLENKLPPANKVKIRYEEGAQAEIWSPQGVRILIDIADVSGLSGPPAAGDILLTTHTHPDHYSPDFFKSFPGQKLLGKTGNIKVKDVEITAIASSHTAAPILAENATNYLYKIVIGGTLTIVHFGDAGQDAFSDGQLKEFGSVDIAFMQFDNGYSQMNMDNKKGFKLMDQVKPNLIIPTHYINASVEYAKGKWSVRCSASEAVVLGNDVIYKDTLFLILGLNAKLLKKELALRDITF
jgi:hypothetical protein